MQRFFEPNQYAAPATHIQAFVNGVVATHLPDHQQWIHAYDSDKELSLVRDLIRHPDKLCNAILKHINYNYHSALHQGLIILERNLLVYREPISGGLSYMKLIVVPASLRNVIFIAFHSNAIGRHFNAYHTLHHIRLRYY